MVVVSHIKQKLLHVIFVYCPKILSDKVFLTIMYRYCLGNEMNWDHPKSFNQKLQWLKLNDRRPIYTSMVDKFEVKSWIDNKIGKGHTIPTIGLWDKFEKIDFSRLPDSFVLKCTHDSGSVILCQDKNRLNVQNAKCKLEGALSKNFYWMFREWPYKGVKPRIMAEPFLGQRDCEGNIVPLEDYKFFCFNGIVRFFKVDFDRFSKHGANYYDRSGNLLHFGEMACPPDFSRYISLPPQLNDMIVLAEKISSSIQFLRVDFFIDGQFLYIGELTFYPNAGFGDFIPKNMDLKIGSLLKIK